MVIYVHINNNDKKYNIQIRKTQCYTYRSFASSIHVSPSGWITNANIVNKARAVNAGGGHAWGSILPLPQVPNNTIDVDVAALVVVPIQEEEEEELIAAEEVVAAAEEEDDDDDDWNNSTVRNHRGR